jgi:integrase
MYSPADIKALWNCPGLPDYKLAFLRFILLTPLRRQEGADILIENISTGASGYLEIMVRETKNGTDLRVPLTGEAAQIVIDQRGDRKTGNLFEVGCFKKLTKKIRDNSGVAEFAWHDTRRTFTSIAAELELASFDTIDAMLNHLSAEAKSGVRAHYNRSAGIPARARLLSRWENVVRHAAETGQWPAQTAADNVVQIGKRA